MAKDEAARKQILKGLILSPFTYFPIMAGISVSAISWAVGSFLGIYPAIVGGLLSFGVFVSRVLFVSDKDVNMIRDRILAEDHERREAELNELDAKLVKDKDPRTQELLRQVRDLADSIKRDTDWREHLDRVTVNRISVTVSQMFDECVNHLRRSLELREKARQARSEKLTGTYRKQLEDCIHSVEKTVKELDAVIATMHGFTNENGQLDVLNQQLKAALEVGQKTREQIDALGIRETL